ncbi:MAG: hypothetical protein HY259_09075 [Chloroflexi bacterium]|nr:hypothetical protein [Chloroflexota bacterium]
MHWILWFLAFVSLGAPVGILTIDRILGLPARTLFKWWGIPLLVLFILAILGALITGDSLIELIFWGALGGIFGTVFLDAVRLAGLRLGAFPMDMPKMFGAIALGLAPRLQRNVMGQLVAYVAAQPKAVRAQMLGERLRALPRLSEPIRVSVVSAMRRGLERLPDEQRATMMATQMGLMAELPSADRRAVMAAMDKAAQDGAPVYAQPRGMPQLPMWLFRRLVVRAYPQTLEEAGVSRRKAIALGYIWHFVMGATFGITYTLLFGQGAWPLAILWGVFVWAMMMILMPPMMPLIKFPWWFIIVPFIAHIAMAIPIGFFAFYVSPQAVAGSLLGALLR